MSIKKIIASVGVVTALIASSAVISEDGKALYETNCAACHQVTGAGIPGAFPPLAQSDYLAEIGKEGAIKNVLHGFSGEITVNGTTYNGVMPPMAYLSDEQVASILTYVFASWENGGGEVTAADVTALR